jgi:hypothetical protein
VSSPLWTSHFSPNRPKLGEHSGSKRTRTASSPVLLARLAVTQLPFYPFPLSTLCAANVVALQPWTPLLPPPHRRTRLARSRPCRRRSPRCRRARRGRRRG